MKKIVYSITCLTFLTFAISPANANMEVVMGTVGPQVVTNMNPGTTLGPTVGGNNGGTIGGVGGGYAVVDNHGTVTNIIVCHHYCEQGTLGPGGPTVVLQTPGREQGLWAGPGTTTYDRETKTFTVFMPESVENKNDGNNSTIVSGRKVLTFAAGNVFIKENGEVSGVTESWTEQSTAIISSTNSNITESLYLGNRKTNQEVRSIINDSNLLLLNDKVNILIELLGSWVK